MNRANIARLARHLGLPANPERDRQAAIWMAAETSRDASQPPVRTIALGGWEGARDGTDFTGMTAEFPAAQTEPGV